MASYKDWKELIVRNIKELEEQIRLKEEKHRAMCSKYAETHAKLTAELTAELKKARILLAHI